MPEIAVGFAAMSVLLAAAFNIVSSVGASSWAGSRRVQPAVIEPSTEVSIILVNKQIASVCRRGTKRSDMLDSCLGCTDRFSSKECSF